MVLILPEHSQRPYRYGMTLLCIGAMFNWLGLADNNAEPVRYIGVTLIAAGAMLICMAMCFWMKATHDPQVAAMQAEQDAVHHIVTIQRDAAMQEKPPDYDSVTGAAPPSYEDAIKLSPAHLVVDCMGGETLKPEGEGQSGTSTVVMAGESQSTSTICQVHAKPDASSSDESSADNFGSKVLRISRKFLRRPKSDQEAEEPRSSSEQDGNTAPDISVR